MKVILTKDLDNLGRAGALVDVGRRRQPVEWIDALLGGSTTGLRLAPPQGLVQVAVEY